MTPEQRAQRKQAREDAEQQRIRQSGFEAGRQLVAERGPVPDQVLRDVIRPALVEAAQAQRSTRHPA